MKEVTSRVLLYGSAVLALGGIAVTWANTNTEADVMTLLSSADVQLRMAYTIPNVDQNGQPIDARENLITSAVEHLEKVERIEPGMAVTSEFRGFAHMLEGEFAAAAACYQRARDCDDCAAEQFDILAFNQARMLAKAGRHEAALEVFGQNAAALDERFGHQRRIEEAAILREMGQEERAIAQLREVLAEDGVTSMTRLQAGRQLVELGSFELAEQALAEAAKELPIADYYMARLKLRQGKVDTCLELLERVVEARPIEVRRLLRKESDAWSGVSEDARFQRLDESTPASPGR